MKKKNLVLVFSFFLFAFCLNAENVFRQNDFVSYDGFCHTVLDNGTELFVAENHNTHLITIEIAFRAGSTYQTAQTEGIFHLYEHMLFKGNSLYKTAAAIKNAMTTMGVSDYNGSTANDYVNYFFTIPENSFENGMEFWAAAVQTPLFDEAELENEKKVVVSEINGTLYSINTKITKKVMSTFFPERKHTFSPSGNEQQVLSCTRETLLKMQRDFYNPENCALFISGDITKENALALTKKYFASWRTDSAIDATSEKDAVFAKNDDAARPISRDYLFYAKSPNFSSFLTIYFAGPDTTHSKSDTYTSDILSTYFSNANSSLYKSVHSLKTIQKKPAVNDFGFSYLTVKINGLLIFYFELESDNPKLYETIEQILRILTIEEFNKMKNPDYFNQKIYEKTMAHILDAKEISFEDTANLMETLRFFWATSDTEYAVSYYENLQNVDIKSLDDFTKKYLINKNYCAFLYLNSSAYENQIENIEKIGFEEVK